MKAPYLAPYYFPTPAPASAPTPIIALAPAPTSAAVPSPAHLLLTRPELSDIGIVALLHCVVGALQERRLLQADSSRDYSRQLAALDDLMIFIGFNPVW